MLWKTRGCEAKQHLTVSKITDNSFFLLLHILLSVFSQCFIMNTHHKFGKNYFRSFKRKKSQWAGTCDERLVLYGSKVGEEIRINGKESRRHHLG